MANKRRTHRSVLERVLVRGTLVLESPAHFGSGEPDALTDMPVLLNEADGRPLLPGTSIAGALRNYLREFEFGDSVPLPENKDDKQRHADESTSYSALLFGGYRGDDDGSQSPLVVEDSVGTLSSFELRDGVAIAPASRTAADDKKFDIQLLAAGTTFPLQFELAISENREKLLNSLATALKGLAEGEITLGARKRRGFGKCTVRSWEVCTYRLQQPDELLAWLSAERHWDAWPSNWKTDASIEKLLGASVLPNDRRRRVTLKATFALDSTLLIRSGFGEADTRADTVHLHASRPNGKNVPVIPGTSWAGVLRHQALKIARTLSDREVENDKGETVKFAQVLVDNFFGPSDLTKDERHAVASRVSIEESEVRKSKALEITRVKIDRFTGGAYESALFTEQPLVGTPDSEVDLTLTLRQPALENVDTQQYEAEIGLLLLVLKDLWTGNLPVGGESGVGRGYLQGLKAELSLNEQETWLISQADDGKLSLSGDQENLQSYVDALKERMVGK
jgi:CRISPR/Cas system CSM-associated protein Csm3 (group 7 of RAMP superfamily)